LRRETLLAFKWILARVRLGTTKSAKANLRQWMPAPPEPGIEPQTAAKMQETAKMKHPMG